MKKTSVLWIVLNSIFLIIFNAVFFIAGGTGHSISVWISYAFIHFAYLMLLATPKLVRSGKSAAVLGITLSSISAAYFLVAFITGIVFILWAPDGWRVALLVQLCVAGLYGILLISNMIANEYTADAEEKRKSQIEYVKTASAKMKSILDMTNDKESKKKVEKIYDALYSSPVKSHPGVEEIERKILLMIDELGSAVMAKNQQSIAVFTDSLQTAINERNSRLKTLN